MLKSDKIFEAVKELKKDLLLNRRKGSFRGYGSFYHPRKKYVSDIDIHYLLNVENISSEENYITDIIKKHCPRLAATAEQIGNTGDGPSIS